MKSVYSLNDLYPNSAASQTTTGETIPEDVERKQYQDSTVVTAEGKTEMVDSKLIFIAIAAFIGVAYLLNLME